MATSVTLKPNAIDISGSTSGTTTLQASAVAGTTTLTLPAATDTLVGKATTDTLTNKTLTGAAMNGTLGATTPSTASVTTLTTSSTVTHSGGTANGVAYLDGSKVLTTGSALVFDGTNLGVGTSSPVNKFVVSNAGANGFEVNPASGISSGAALNGYNRSTSAYTPLTYSALAHYFQVGSSPSTQATLDSSGNWGLGVTPNAWGTYSGIIDLKGNGSVAAYNQSILMAANAYYNGTNFIYKATTSAGYHQIAGNQFQWYQAASGTAGNAITFTQAMTLDASGNLSVGTTTASTAGANYQAVTVNGSTGSNLALNGGGTLIGLIYAATGNSNLYVTNQTAGGNLIFGAGSGNERARIDSSGNLLVGATSNVTNAARLLVQTASDYQLTLNASTSSGSVYSAMNFTQAGTVKGAIYQDHANTRLTIQCNGSGGVYLASGATSWTANSDERLKDIIEPITDATNKVSSLRAVIGKYKTDEEGTRRSFLIAQDVQSVLPEAVTSGTLSRSEDTTEYLGVAYTDVIPLLVAAIKEQNQLIQSLTDRISALEQK